MIAELHRVGDIANTDVALRRGDDLACLDAAAALNQFAVEARVLEVSDSVRHELGLIDGHRDRIDHAAGLVVGPGPARCDGGAAAGDDRQRRSSCEIFCHHACSLSLPATFSRAFSTASPISWVESLAAPGSAISAVLAPAARAVPTAFSSRSASPGRLSVMRSIMATLRIEPSGLAMPLPAISGALPCTGSYSALRRPKRSTGPSDADGSMPSEPEAIAAQSDRMSPKILPVTITSNCRGSRTICIAALST